MLTASFDLQWPEQLQKFFSTAKPVSEASTQFISIDCFIDLRQNNTDNSSVRVMLWKTLVLAVSPIVVVIVSYIVWLLIECFKTKKVRKNAVKKD